MTDRRRWGRLVAAIFLTAALAAGCGPGAASGQTGAGGVGGVTGRGGSGAITGSVTLPAGTCGVVRRTPIPSAVPIGTAVQRVTDGFAIGPWTSDAGTSVVEWDRLDPVGPTRTEHFAELGQTFVALDAFIIGPADQVVEVSVGGNDPSSPADVFYQSRLLLPGAMAASSPTTLVSAFYRGTIQHAAVDAFDGQQGLFMVGHIAVEDPKLVVVRADGSPVGEVGVLATTGVWSCGATLPTAHAGALSLIDQTPAPEDAETFHLLEMAPVGGTALEVQMPINRGVVRVGDNFLPPCPLVAVAPRGFVFLSYERTPEGNGSWHLRHVAPDATISDEVWDTLSGTPVALATIGDSVVVVSAESGGASIVKRAGGQDHSFALAQTDAAAQIPSEPGTLFLRGHVLDAAGAITTDSQIVEIGCP